MYIHLYRVNDFHLYVYVFAVYVYTFAFQVKLESEKTGGIFTRKDVDSVVFVVLLSFDSGFTKTQSRVCRQSDIYIYLRSGCVYSFTTSI